MIPTPYTCRECGLEDTVSVTLPKHPGDPQEAGSIDPAECCACGAEFPREELYELAMDQKPE